MRILTTLLLLVGLVLANPAAAGDCFVQTRVSIVADGATKGTPDTFVIALTNLQLWQVHPDNADIARKGIREGHYVQICRSWGSLHMEDRNTGDSFVVFQIGNWQP